MKKSSILVAILGVVIGVLLMWLIQVIGQRRQRLDVSGAPWRKVELILQSISDNYVDSVDYGKVTDAVAQAALRARLKPTWPATSTASASSSTCPTIRPS